MSEQPAPRRRKSAKQHQGQTGYETILYTVGDLSERLTPAYGEHAVRYALAAVSLVPLLASACMFQCARSLRGDLAATRAAV